MKLKNVGFPVGDTVEVSEAGGELLLKLFGGRFAVDTVADIPAPVVVVNEVPPYKLNVDIKPDKPSKRKGQ
jgi:hypothetical protein